MAMKNPATVAAKWSRNLGASGDSIRAGVQAVTTNPAERAIARKDAYVQGVQRAAAEGRYERGLRKVTLQMWQEAMLGKGLSRIASGAAAGQSKMAAFLEKWLPHEEALKQKLASMPRGDLQQNMARCMAAIEHNAAFRMT